MKLSIVLSVQPTNFASVIFEGKIEERLQKIRALGYDGVELAIRDPSLVDWRQLEKSITKSCLEVPAIGTGQAYLAEGLSFSSSSPEIRKRAVERIRSQISFAKQFHAGVIIGLVRGKAEANEDAKMALTWMVDSLKACCETAEKEGVPLWIEPLNRYETNLINTIEEGIALLNQTGSKSLGLLPDTFHMNIEEPEIEQSLRRARPFIQHLHVADSNRWPPGFGHIDFRSIIQVLKETEYQGYLSVECLPKPSADEASERAIGFLRKII